MPPNVFSSTIFRLRPRVELMEERTLLSTFLVDNTGDSGPGSLRQAILDSNAATVASNTIDFEIPGQGVQTIEPLSPLPTITNPVLIDGFSQPGYAGTPLIEISGSQAGGGNGLSISGSGVTVRGLDVNAFSQGAGIYVSGSSATDDWIYGNFLGTDPTGTQADANYVGVEIDGGASQNLVGTNGDGVDDAAEQNLLSGNSLAGVWIWGRGTDANAVAGNLIGTDVTGESALGNTSTYYYDPEGGFLYASVVISGGASGNRIGTDGMSVDDVAGRNVISGNNGAGIDIDDSGTDGNIVAGNFIGTDVTGSIGLKNNGDGIFIGGGASSNWIGVYPADGTALGDEGNVISGNAFDGVQIDQANGNVISGDEIGTDVTGTIALGSAYGDGVEVDQSSNNTIGGLAAGAGDVISGNAGAGVELVGSSDNLVEGDDIGTDATGMIALGNRGGGVAIDSAFGPSVDNTIGGSSAVAGNLITDNGGPGVTVTGDSSVGNQITANSIFGNVGQAIDLGDDGVTYNGSAPRQGPNNLQNFPIIITTTDGQLQGGLWGSSPDTTFDIEFYASAGYNSDGSGEAQDFLGSLEVTTNDQGEAVFNLPYSPTAGLPILTLTATDSQGNTSEVSAIRATSLEPPDASFRTSPGESIVITSGSGQGITLEDPDAGPLQPVWSMTLSVGEGSLMLSTTAGLVGSGDGTGFLSYSGTLAALNAAMDGLHYTPEPGYQGFDTLTLNAQSEGAAPLQAQTTIDVTDGVFPVTTMADSGPGSLRQAILDSNAATGGTNTIDFAIPGPGVHTIDLDSALPPITNSVVVDGTTQPGYAGTALIAIDQQPSGSPAPLVVSSGDVTVRGLALALVSIDPITEELLIADLHAPGQTAQLSLDDAQGQVLVQSDGLSPADPDDVIDEHLSAGVDSLQADSAGGPGDFTWTIVLTPASTPFQPIPVGADPNAIVAGDFNGDGRLDLAVVNSDNDDISVLISNGDGTFQPQVTYPVGSEPNAIVAGDFTGDGKLDLAVVDSSVSYGSDGMVSVLLGNGDGTFQPAQQYTVGENPEAIVAGDFTGDARLDLAVADSGSNAVSILLGNGDGTFQPAQQYAVGSKPVAIAAGDFTGDGQLDLAVADEDSNQVSILLGNGDGNFQPAVDYLAGANPADYPAGIVAGDFTGDGRLDLAVSNLEDYSVSVLLGNGDGTFQPAVRYGGLLFPTTIVAGDFTDDGHLDLAVAVSNGVSILLGNGDGTFAAPVQYAVASAQTLVASDFTDDGHLDLAVLANDDVDPNGTVSILLGNGNGTFQTQADEQAGSSPQGEVAGDFNGDGKLDLAVVDNGSDTVSILLGNGDGAFQPAVQYAVGPDPYAIVAGDFNGDGRLDLAVANGDYGSSGTVSVLMGNGDGTFQPQLTYAVLPDSQVIAEPQAIVAGDFTGNGNIDLAVADYGSSDVSILLGNGNGTFQFAQVYPVESGPDAIAAGDFTGNGRDDLAVGYLESDDLSILLSNSDGTFQPAVQYSAGLSVQAIVVADFNGDGKSDLALASLYASTVAVLLGNGDGTFQPAVQYNVAYELGAIVAGNFTGDGHIDLAVADSLYDQVFVLPGNGDGTFQPPVPYAVGSYPDALVAGDFTGSGQLDLVAANQGSDDVSVLLGVGGGTFVDPGQFDTTPYANPLVADVDGDGTDDVLVVDGSGDILYRQGIPGQTGAYEPPITVNPGFSSRDIAWVPDTLDGPLLASVDAQDHAVSLYSWRNGGFVRIGSLASGQLPAQIIAANLNGTGWDDLVVRNAGDGTLTVYFNNQVGSFLTGFDQPFLPALTIPVGVGVSDVQAIETNSDGHLNLLVTNKLTGLVSVLYNDGDDSFAEPVPYLAGTGLSAIDPDGTPEITSFQGTAGVAAGPLTPGGANSLVTINPGTNTLDVLANLGGGEFANPVAIQTPSAALAIRMGDFTDDGLDDLAVLTADGLSIYLGNGQGGFLPPTTYAVPSEADGLTVVDLLGNGKLDLLVGDAYGDVLVLLGNGDGTFSPYHEANQTVELAVADLTGNGSKDIIYADQGLDRVVVDYGAGNSDVLADQSTGLLEPGAVALADLNGDGIPDLIVANSGSNNVLIYPGLGNGQFGPAINDGNGYFVGTDPVGITVADLKGAKPDLVIADEGSNQVSILLNMSQDGVISFEAGPRLNAGGSGPVSTVVGDFTGGTYPDLLVTNSLSNDVTLLRGVGQGFFNDQDPRIYAVGAAPGPTFVGDFTGQPDLVTVNARSNDLTLISGFESSNPITTTIASGGVDPDAAFAFASPGGEEDLVVANAGDGALALYEGGPEGLELVSTESEPGLPAPTALAFSTLTGGQVQFYAATAGRESAELVSLNLNVETSTAASSPAVSSALSSPVVQIVALNDTSLPLVVTVLTLTIESSGAELGIGPSESEAVSFATFLPGSSSSFGQGMSSQGRAGPVADEVVESEGSGGEAGTLVPGPTSLWERFLLGLDEALERFRGANPDGLSGAAEGISVPERSAPQPAPGAVPRGGSTGLKRSSAPLPIGEESGQMDETSASIEREATDAVIQALWIDAEPGGMALGGQSTRVIRECPRGGILPGQPSVGPMPALIVAVMVHHWVDRRIFFKQPRFPGRSGETSPTRRRAMIRS
jgi:hypothetical protein